MLDGPEGDLDRALRALLREESSTLPGSDVLTPDGVDLVKRILRSLKDGSKCVFIAVHPEGDDEEVVQIARILTEPHEAVRILSKALAYVAERELSP